MTTRVVRLAALIVTCAGLIVGCGGGDDTPPAPPPPMIGAAGGTVSGPNGAQVVVPAGALAANTAIAVAQSSSGAPALPAGVNPLGSMFAFTPHGTTFAVPVTITVPFNAGSLPAGATALLYKTDAAGAWELVANAAVNAATVTVQVSSFSWLIVGNLPPQITTQPADVTVAEPATATFSVTALGTPPFTYQWQKSDDAGATFNNIAGGTAGSHTTGATSVAADHGDRYRVLVSNLEGTSTSSAATLTVTAGTALNLTGIWISTYQCTGSGGNFAGQDTLTVTQTGTAVTFTSQPDGGSFAGTLSGNTMTYSGGGPGYSETGTWTIQGANNFTKTSNYTRLDGSGGGSCPGTGQRQ